MSRRRRDRADAQARVRSHRLWAGPVVLAVLTVAGLASALVGDGWWDAVSWVALGIPMAAALWFGVRRSRSGRPRHD